MRLIRRLLFWFRQRREAADLAEEMEFHRQMAERDLGGRAAAQRIMGATLIAQENARAVWLAPWLESVFQDLRYAVRSLQANPGFTAMALLALGLGIGLNTSLFTVFDAIAYRPWPVTDPGRVATILAFDPKNPGDYFGFSGAELRYFRDHAHWLTGAFLMHPAKVSLDAQADGPRTVCYFVSGSYFSVLGVAMALGRGFADDEDRPEAPAAVAVLNYETWRTRYGGDPHMVGRQIRVNDVPFTVVGVAGARFTGTSPGPHDLWLPLSVIGMATHDPHESELVSSANWCCSEAAGRLAPGATREEAAAELTALDAQYQAQRSKAPNKILLSPTAFLAQPDGHRKEFLPIFALMLAGVSAVLLLACANVSNLLLARAAARGREIVVRLAIGASRGRIVRQLLTESLLLAAIAAAIGLALARVLPGLMVQRFANEPIHLQLNPDAAILAYTCGIAVLTAVAFGLAPALRATNLSVSDAMKRQSMHASPRFALRSVLLGAQVAISVVLLASAGLLMRGIAHIGSINPGFNVDGITVVSLDLPVSAYDDKRGAIFVRDAVERVRALTRDGKVGVAAIPPLSEMRIFTGFKLAGSAKDESVLMQSVDAGYFEVLGIPVIAGRNFVPGDGDRHAIVINETMAQRYWPNENPLGKVIDTGKPSEIVAVVRDSHIYGLGPVEPVFFETFSGGQSTTLLLKGGAGAGWVRQVTAVLTRQEPRAVVGVGTVADQMDRWLGPSRTGAMLAAALGSLALLLATVGVYGVIGYSVEQRRREIGVRMALGARPRQIVWLVARSNARALLVGSAVGFVMALAVATLLRNLLYGVSPLDPLAYGVVAALLLAAGIAASIVPSRRAAAIAPMEALHYE
jgi:putative ABC transport system permease protein